VRYNWKKKVAGGVMCTWVNVAQAQGTLDWIDSERCSRGPF